MDKRLINHLESLVKKERKINEFKRRLRLKGKVISKGSTKKGNITLTINKEKIKNYF